MFGRPDFADENAKVLTEMATWQFDFHLIPKKNVERLVGCVPLTIARHDLDDLDWWAGVSVPDIEGELSRLLPKGEAWTAGQELWGQDDGHRFDL